MQIDKKIIGAFVLGVFITVFVYQAFTIYQIREMVWNNHATVEDIVNFINTSLEQQQGGMPSQSPTDETPSATEIEEMLGQ